MSPVGGGKPLFDLISAGRRSGDAPPPPRRDPGRNNRDPGARSVTVPMVWVYAGVALLLVLLIGGYGIGYRLGTGSARETERRDAERDAQGVFIDDPLHGEGGRSNTPQPSGSGDAVRRSLNSGGSSADGSAGGSASGTTGAAGGADLAVTPGMVLLGSGAPGPDPRRAGVNYLELVTLPREQAIEAVRYLSGNGEEAIAVPVGELDPRRRRSNTSDSFRVIALGLAVPGDRYSSSADARRRFEDRLRRLGKAWTDEGGVSDFSDPLWRRFGG